MKTSENDLSSYDASPALRKVILRMYQYRFPNCEDTSGLLAKVEAQIQHSVRGFIGTLGNGLDASKGDTYNLTENGVMRSEVRDAYLARLPVRPGDEDALANAITDDLFKHANTPVMTMVSAKLVEQDGELVVIGMEYHNNVVSTKRVRAKLDIL